MHSVRIEPAKLILVGTRITYQATGDAGLERYKFCGQTVKQRKTKLRSRIKVGKSSASVPGTRAQQKNATREIRATKKKGKLTKSGIPGWFLNKIGYLFFRDGVRFYARLQHASQTRSGA